MWRIVVSQPHNVYRPLVTLRMLEGYGTAQISPAREQISRNIQQSARQNEPPGVTRVPTQSQNLSPEKNLRLGPRHRPGQDSLSMLFRLRRASLSPEVRYAGAYPEWSGREKVRKTFIGASLRHRQPSGSLFRVSWELEQFMQEEFPSDQVQLAPRCGRR